MKIKEILEMLTGHCVGVTNTEENGLVATKVYLDDLADELSNLLGVNYPLPSESEMYNEMERKFRLGKNHEDGMGISDTQIGWKECYKWISKRNRR